MFVFGQIDIYIFLFCNNVAGSFIYLEEKGLVYLKCLGSLQSLKLNGMHKILAYADNFNIVGGKIDTIQKNSKSLLDTSKEVGLEVNPEKIKYMLNVTLSEGRMKA
jgi:hypothetical protein